MATILVERFLAQWPGRSSQPPKAEVIRVFNSCHLTIAPWQQSHNSFIHPAVNINAALGGGWPTWQPLNVAVAMSYWPDASRRVSCQAAAAMQQTVATRTTVILVLWLWGLSVATWWRQSSFSAGFFFLSAFFLHFVVFGNFSKIRPIWKIFTLWCPFSICAALFFCTLPLYKWLCVPIPLVTPHTAPAGLKSVFTQDVGLNRLFKGTVQRDLRWVSSDTNR